jgi:hypothetical protein
MGAYSVYSAFSPIQTMMVPHKLWMRSIKKAFLQLPIDQVFKRE